MANILEVELIADSNNALRQVDAFEREIVGTERRLTQLGTRGREAGREIASGLGLPIGAAAAVTVGIGLMGVALNKGIDAARLAADANRVLSASATEAGLAYDVATQKAEKFASQTGLAGTEAKQTFASIIQVAKVAGQTDDLENIQKRFADLAAARGVAARDLSTLAQQILSGQDEALNRLGLADPSRLAKEWAEAHGTTVEAMTQTQLVASRLDAVVRKGAMFDGSAAERLASVEGQFILTEQAAANLTTELGQTILQSMEVRDILKTVNEVLQDISFSSDDVAKKLNQGLTPAQIAAQEAGSAWNITLDAIKNTLNLWPSVFQAAADAMTPSGKSFAEIAAQFKEMAFGADDRRRRALEEQIVAEQKSIEAQKKAAEEQKRINADKASADIAAAKEKQRLAELEKQQKKQKEIDEQIQNTFKDTRAFLDEMILRVNKDNPFVALFSQADTVMERMQKRFGVFGQEFVGMMAKVENQAIEMEKLAARIQSAQKVLDIQAEIRRLQFGPTGASGEDQRRLGVFGREIDAARDIPRLEAQARAIDQAGFGRGPNALDQGAILNQQIQDVLRLKTQFFGDTAFGTREAQSKINEQLIALFEGASPAMQAALIQRGGRGFRQEIADAYRGQAQDRTQAIQDEIKRAEAGRFAVQAAQIKLDDLRRFGGFDSDEVRKQFLAVTGALSETELTPEMRRGRIGALEIEAKKEAEKEKQAEQDRKLLNEVLTMVRGQILGKGLKVDQTAAGILVEVKDTSSKAQVTGPGFSSDDAAAAGRKAMMGL